MKILQITPAEKSAIYTLAKAIQNHNQQLEIKLLTFHPKKPSPKEIKNMEIALKWADIIDVQYWKSGSKIREMFGSLWQKKPKMLTHYNPYNLHEENWAEYKKLIVVNKTQQKGLPNAKLIPLCVDLDFFKPIATYTKEKVVNMTVSRIEGKKGVFEVAQACAELGYKFILVGRISDPNYVNDVRKAGGKLLEFHKDVSDVELRNCYYKSAIHVFNSVDNFESGSLPVLEAMGCGIPVLAREIGHIPDIYTGKNLKLFLGNQSELKAAIKELMENEQLRQEIRANARESIKDRNHQNYAKNFLEIYKEMAG